MDNNRGRQKDRPKSNPALRKVQPKDFADAGFDSGKKPGPQASPGRKTGSGT